METKCIHNTLFVPF